MFNKQFKRCQFDMCAFKHIGSDDDLEKLKNENQSLLEKINKIGKDLETLIQKEKV